MKTYTRTTALNNILRLKQDNIMIIKPCKTHVKVSNGHYQFIICRAVLNDKQESIVNSCGDGYCASYGTVRDLPQNFDTVMPTTINKTLKLEVTNTLFQDVDKPKSAAARKLICDEMTVFINETYRRLAEAVFLNVDYYMSDRANNSPITVVDNDEIVGVIMPMRVNENDL